MISRLEAQAKFRENQETLGSHEEVFTDGSKMNERVGAAEVINRHFQNGETTCRHFTKRLPDKCIIVAAEATAITLALNYYQHMGPVHHDVIVYSDSVLLAGDWGWRHWEPFYLPYHELPLVVEWERHTYSFLLNTKPLWHRQKWKSWPAGEGDPWPWHRSSGRCPLCRFETSCQLLHPAAGSTQKWDVAVHDRALSWKQHWGHRRNSST